MKILPNEIHIWSACLNKGQADEKANFTLLHPDERERADRYRFPIHRQRFILARSTLRKILSIYLNIPPAKIQFTYNPYKKPLLAPSNNCRLQFNLSHSDSQAVYAITTQGPVGIDIEKMRKNDSLDIAKRFFSDQEIRALSRLPDKEKVAGFYRIWSRKEALVKALGKGMTIPFSSFSVSVHDLPEVIQIDNKNWYLLPVKTITGFQAAAATSQRIKTTHFQHFD